MGKVEITIEFDDQRLTSYTDEHLAVLWHVAQANPADAFEDSRPGETAERIGREIISRWLRSVQPELYHHQGHRYYWNQLRQFATYQPPPGVRGGPEWHEGTWVPRPAGDDTSEAGNHGAEAAGE